MQIKTNHVTIQASDVTKDGSCPRFDTVYMASGYAAALRFHPDWAYYVLLKEKDSPFLYIAAIHNEKWLPDLLEDGKYKVIKILNKELNKPKTDE